MALLATLAAWPVLPVGAEPDDARVDYAYSGSGAAEGRFDGQCASWGLILNAGALPTWSLDAAGGILRVHTTTVNYSVVRDPPDESRVVLDTHQTSELHELPAGRLAIDWPANGILALFAPGYPLGPGQPLNVTFQEAERAEWSQVTSDLPAPASFWYPIGGEPYRIVGDYPGWKRELAVTGGAIGLHGDLVAYARDVSLTLPDGAVHRLPPYATESYNVTDPSGHVTYTSVRYTDAFLELTGASLRWPGSAARVVCADLSGRVDGSLTLNAARGRYAAGRDNVSFEDRALTLQGSFRLREAPEDLSPAPQEPGRITGSGWGRIEAVGLDFRAAPAPSGGMRLLAGVGAVGAAAALLALLVRWVPEAWAFCYTRLSGDVVADHPRRAMLLDFVRANPGCNPTDVAQATGMARGIVNYHALVLARAGHLQRAALPGRVMLVARGNRETTRVPGRFVAERDPRLRFILDAVEAGTVRQMDLIRQVRGQFGVRAGTARKWVVRAVRLGVLSVSGERKRTVYACTT